MSMEDKIFSALLDLRTALGELLAAIADVDQAITKLMAVQLDVLDSKNAPATPSPSDEQKKES